MPVSECPLEDHELIKDVIGRWPSKNPPKLVLRDFASKNILWSVNPPVHARKEIMIYLSDDIFIFRFQKSRSEHLLKKARFPRYLPTFSTAPSKVAREK